MHKEITFYVFLGEKRDPSEIYVNSNLRNMTHITQKPSYVYTFFTSTLKEITALVPVYRQLRYLSFGPQNRTPKIPAGLSGVPPLCTGEKKNNQSFTLTLRPQKCSRHPATRITLDARPPPLPLPPPSVRINGSLLLHIVGGGYHGRVGRLDGGRRVLLLSLSSY
jgi:hypothetical protein